MRKRVAHLLRAIADVIAAPEPTHITVNVRMPDGKALTQLVLRDVLNRAARGPSNMIGGGLGGSAN